MSLTDTGAPAPANDRTPASHRAETVRLGAEEVRVENVSARKASRAFALLRMIAKSVPGIMDEVGEFRRQYEASNVIELDRAQARVRYGDALDKFAEEDWQTSGNKLRIPVSPSTGEVIAAIFPTVLDTAEEHLYQLLALFTMSNADVKRYRQDGTLEERLRERADEILDDALADEVLELAVVCGEVIDDQFTKKAADLGGRLGNALRLFGMGPKTTTATSPTASESADGNSTSTPTSSTDGPSASDGDPTTPSTPTTASSTPSVSASPQPTPVGGS